MAELVVGAMGGAMVSEVLKILIEEAKKMSAIESVSNKLASTMESLLPLVTQIESMQDIDQLKDLMDTIDRARVLVRKYSNLQPWNMYRRSKYTKKIEKIISKMLQFSQIQLQLVLLRNQLQSTFIQKLDLLSVPKLSMVPVGLDWPLMELKKKLLNDAEHTLVVSAPAGCGKTTLVIQLCHDEEIKGKFKNIFFCVVSSTSNFRLIVQNLYRHNGSGAVSFENDHQAVNGLRNLLEELQKDGPILLVLDDVWNGALLQKFGISSPDFKILVTSRFQFPSFGPTYHLKFLEDKDAMALFIQCAPRPDHTSPDEYENLLQKSIDLLSVPAPLIDRDLCSVPKLNMVPVGLDCPLKQLKKKLLNDVVDRLVVSAPAGCGKTTLVTQLCHDEEIKGVFTNIFYSAVSSTPDFRGIVQNLLQHNGYGALSYEDNSQARAGLRKLLVKLKKKGPILLVLDDVWRGAESFLENFRIDLPDYTILVTSRSYFPHFGSTYDLKPLEDEDAMALLIQCAPRPDHSSPVEYENLLQEILRCCNGFPLVIEVLARSLKGQSLTLWKVQVENWSKGETIRDNPNLLDCLQPSFDALESNLKECFSDMGSFIEDQKIRASSIIDIWVELYSKDSDIQCMKYIKDLASQNLLKLVYLGKNEHEDGFYNDFLVTQHDILRELAICQSESEAFLERKRLNLKIRDDIFPDWCLNLRQPINARLLSISTDDSFSSNWVDMDCPNVEALVLHISSSDYALPSFIAGMTKLKVLTIMNRSFYHARLSNFSCLSSLPNLKRIRLEKASITLMDILKLQLGSLKKLSLFMCRFGEVFYDTEDIVISTALSSLQEIDLDYCYDLDELPYGVSEVVSLNALSITNCSKLSKLPDDIGNLSKLEILRLSSCIDLSELPHTTEKLSNLRFLDISHCSELRKLPLEIGKLHKLKKISMRKCWRCALPDSVRNLENLEVKLDEESAYLWKNLKPVMRNLIVNVESNRKMLTTEVINNNIPIVNMKVDLCSVPKLNVVPIEPDWRLMELKKMLLDGFVVRVVVCAPAECGKTTLVTQLCHNEEIKGKFKHIFFNVVSRPPNFRVLVQNLLQHNGYGKLTFANDDQAASGLRSLVEELREEGPILLVLDDVWRGAESLLHNCYINLPDYQILVTSRSDFPSFGSTYHLKPLKDEDPRAEHSSRPRHISQTEYEDLLPKILKRCNGSPLVIEVVGRSLKGSPLSSWKGLVESWDLQPVLKHLQPSYNALKPQLKECFLDMGSFLEDQKIRASLIIDIWVELYGKGSTVCMKYLEDFASQNLLKVVPLGSNKHEDGFYNEFLVTQHDILRDLAICQTESEARLDRKRLNLEIREDTFPDWCLNPRHHIINASLLSISTDDLFSSSWVEMDCPNVEALVLNLSSSEYELPSFIAEMKKLKVLIITNHGSSSAKLSNFSCLSSLPNLKRIRMEKVSITLMDLPQLQLGSLKKLSLFMCSFGDVFYEEGIVVSTALSSLQEIDIDYCYDLDELPYWVSEVVSLKTLSITNCNKLSILPEDIGNLSKLEVLRLCSCINLSELPETTARLSNLQFLDISDCLGLKKLPLEIGKLQKLKKISMRKCSGCELPESVRNLENLEVKCDEETGYLWKRLKQKMRNLTIYEEETEHNLNLFHMF